MGFNAEIRVLYPEKDKHPGNRVWQGREAISFGHVTRLQKLVDRDRYGHIIFDSHQRAGISVTSIYLGKLWERLQAPKTSDFAPPFLIRDKSWRWDTYAVPAQEYTDLVYVRGYEDLSEPLALHNKIVGLEGEALSERINRYHLILDQVPVMWESCATLVDWLNEAEGQRSSEWQELEKDPVSQALARAWRSYFREVSVVGARAMFWFPRY